MLVYDVLGVGIGPSNLSLSALLYPQNEISSLFLDKKFSFAWHNGMLMPEAGLQVSFLKDLVTLVDPTNPFSFLNFLKEEGRLYRHSMTRFPSIKRKEFNQYYNWAISKMANLRFGCDVVDVTFLQDRFLLNSTSGMFAAKHLVVGVGLVPYIPDFMKTHLSNEVFHSSEYLQRKDIVANKRVAVIGGGQSGAEIVNNLLNESSGDGPLSINWITRRYNYLPIDDTSFTNELYTPAYSEFFFKLPLNIKDKLLDYQKLTSDGISQDTLQNIYNKLYEMEVIENRPRMCHLSPGMEVKEVAVNGSSRRITCVSMQKDVTVLDADIIILATGYQHKIPAFMKNIQGEFRNGDQIVSMNEDFSIRWDGPAGHKIFIQNGNKRIWGVPNPNLSLNAWRSAKIVNSLLNTERYLLKKESSVFAWPASNEYC
ncbi:lysine N(6)-hydroxylase/L-ornithine N(5)-oxygenase family protein [Chitinophaga flava]|uniref:L-lysine 6-monooxygenase n=1 Tax=Chitinophaga flava TaxID=2259036 RepID=A0A365Y0A8_9BACT|nr:SidA/IucD/PvdA family monooxygenase [Chitinophaga flava]RBL92033.1 L-lysine 6-monooxygenase [Chitinophaga flava]